MRRLYAPFKSPTSFSGEGVDKCQAVSTTLCDFYMVHHILRTSTQSSNAFRSESFPQSRSSCCSAFARESAVYRICPKAAPRFLAQAARAAHSISTVAQPSAFRYATISLVSRKKAVCRPCDALTEGKTQRTEGLFLWPAPLPRPVLHTGRQEDSDRMCPHPAALWSG